MSRRGGGEVLGGREPGTRPLPPPPLDGGDKGGTTEPAAAGWGGPGRKGCRRARSAPTPIRTPPSRCPLPEQLRVAWPPDTPSRRIPGHRGHRGHRGRGRSLPGPGHRGGAEPCAGRVCCPPARPARRLSPPTPPRGPQTLRPIPAPSRQARGPGRGWRPGRGAKGAPGPRAEGRGAEPTLLASSLLRSIRARVSDSIRDILPPGGSGSRGVAAGPRRPAPAGEVGGRPPARAGWGQEVGLPAPGTRAPVPQTRVSTPRPGAGRGRRGGAGRVPAGTPARGSGQGRLGAVRASRDGVRAPGPLPLQRPGRPPAPQNRL